MRKKKIFTKTVAAALSVCMVSGAMSGMVPANVMAANPVDANWDEIQSIVSRYYGEWKDTSYPGAITNKLANTALLGNGDVGIVSGGNDLEKTFYVSKGDFWEYSGDALPIGGVTIKQSKEEVVETGVNLAPTYKNLTASANYDSFPAKDAVSGEIPPNASNGYGWVTGIGKTHWLQLEFEEPIDIARYVVKSDAFVRPAETAYTTSDFELQISDTGEEGSWVAADTVVGNSKANFDTNLEEPVKAKFVRLYITKPTQETTADSINNPRARIVQFELYAEPKAEVEEPEEPGKFYEKQDILNAEIQTEQQLAGVPTEMKTWLASDDNIMVTELTSKGSKDAEFEVDTWATTENRGIRPITSENDEDSVTITRTTQNLYKNKEQSYTSKAALSTKVIGPEEVVASSDQEKANGKLEFTLKAGETVYIVSAIGGGGRTYTNTGDLWDGAKDPVEDAAAVLDSVNNEDEINELNAERQDWWKDFWSASYIDFGTEDSELNKLQKYYYGAQYILGSTAREGEIAPGIYGVWHTVDNAQWSSGYTLNYNFISTFYGTYSSNRPEFGLVPVQALLDHVPRAQKYATDTEVLKIINKNFVEQKVAKGDIDPVNGIADSVLFNLGVDAWGYGTGEETRGPVFLNEAMCAAYNTYVFNQYYEYTKDEKFLEEKAYDLLKQTVTFYESWLEKETAEDGSYEYVLYAGYNEGSWAKNPAVELAALKNTLRNLISASETLGKDADRREKWIDIYEHLAEQPTTTVNGKKVLALGEKQWNGSTWVDLPSPIPADGNAIPLDAVIPGGVYNYFSPKEDLEMVQNTIDVFSARGAWSQINNFPRLFPDAIKSRYPAETVVTKLAQVINSQMAPNLRINDNCHGTEKSGSTETINSMMLISEEGITKVFPNWLADKDAKFVNLRAKGAFNVSAEYDGATQRTKNVTITSEKGLPMTIVSPWETGAIVKDSKGNVVKTTEGVVQNWEIEENMTLTFDTVAGETYTLERVIPDVTYQATVIGGSGSGEYGKGETVRINAIVPEDKEFVQWVSDDGVVFADAESAKTSFKMPEKPVTVKAELKKAPFIKAADVVAGSAWGIDNILPINLINNSGMSSSKELDATHDNEGGAKTSWHTKNNPGVNAWVQVDLGKVYELGEMWIWNMNQASNVDCTKRGFKNAKIEYSTDGTNWTALEVPEGMDFENGDAEYPFQFAKASGDAQIKATNLNDGNNTPVSFGGTEARYVKITANPQPGNGSWGDTYYGLSELRFTAVDEVEEETDKEWLSALIDYAHSQQEQEEYQYLVPAVKVPFEKALEEAIAVNDNAEATQAEVDAVYDKLLDMVHYLGFTGNSDSLKVLADSARGLNPDLFTEETWAVLEDALAKADAVLANENALQAEIDVARDVLQDAIDGLVRIPVDKDALKKLIDKSQKYVDKIDQYTDGTAKIFTDVLAEAVATYENADASQKDVDAAYAALQNAIFQLRLKPNKDKLDDLIKAAEKVDTSKYTDESAAAFKAALDDAKAVFADGEATKEEVKAAEKALKDAQKNLVAKADADGKDNNKDNNGNNENKDDKAPVKTGDVASVWTMLLGCMAAVATAGTVVIRRKRR